MGNDSKRIGIDGTGKTSIKNFNITSTPITGGGFNGVYTYRRSAKKIRGTLYVLEALWKATGYRAYLVTLTFGNDISNAERYERKQAFTNNLRHYCWHYVWVTELHSDRERVHFHYVVLCRRSKRNRLHDYVVDWSIRYCGSNNGLDITQITKTLFYVAKYIGKEKGEVESDRRLWGKSNFPVATETTKKELQENEYPLYTRFVGSGHNSGGMYVYTHAQKAAALIAANYLSIKT